MQGQSLVNQIGAVQFPCPNCLKGIIIRTKHERALGAKYTCPECKSMGPN